MTVSQSLLVFHDLNGADLCFGALDMCFQGPALHATAGGWGVSAVTGHHSTELENEGLQAAAQVSSQLRHLLSV